MVIIWGGRWLILQNAIYTWPPPMAEYKVVWPLSTRRGRCSHLIMGNWGYVHTQTRHGDKIRPRAMNPSITAPTTLAGLIAEARIYEGTLSGSLGYYTS